MTSGRADGSDLRVVTAPGADTVERLVVSGTTPVEGGDLLLVLGCPTADPGRRGLVARPTLRRCGGISSMTTARRAMDRALRDAVRSELRPLGWTGTLPHLRRRRPEQIDLLSFMHFSSGGSFVAEINACGPDGVDRAWGRESPDKVNVWSAGGSRARLGSPTFPVGDHWFVYGPRNYEPDAAVVQPDEHYDRIAAAVVRLVRQQGEPWWAAWPEPLS